MDVESPKHLERFRDHRAMRSEFRACPDWQDQGTLPPGPGRTHAPPGARRP